MATDLTSNFEFDYSYSGTLGAGQNSVPVYAAFSTSTTIVTVTLNGAFGVSNTIDAAYYAHVVVDPTSEPYTTTFDIGYTSTASSYSYYTTGPNTLKSGIATGGPGNLNGGYGTLELGGAALVQPGASSISFKGIDNTLILDTATPTVSSTLPITNFQAAGDQIVFNGVAASGAVITGYSVGSGGAGTLTYSNGGVSYAITFAGMAATDAAGNFAIGSAAAVEGGNSQTYAGDLVISFVPCFLRGTMIATEAGEVAVETLRAGDLVSVLRKGRRVSRPVVWVGGRAMDADALGGRDEAYPIRILKGAFAENVPHRDLLVTPEHCILTAAGLTPARMLVNGASILIDRSIPCYDFFHVELETHGILISEGLATESYLDSGNRDLFVGTVAGVSMRTDLEMAAPLAVARDEVEPVWKRLDRRARRLGLAAPRTTTTLTEQPNLRLLLDNGRELTPCWHNAQHHMFHIPRGARPMRLRSRAAVPADVIGPFIDDRRRLGVAVDRLVVWSGLAEQVLPARGLELSGWHRDDGAVRWTDGDAELDLPQADGHTFLDVHLAATMLYPTEARPAG